MRPPVSCRPDATLKLGLGLPVIWLCREDDLAQVHFDNRQYNFIAWQPEALADGWSRDRIMQEIGAQGVPCFSGSCSEMYLERAFQDAGLAPAERLPVARELGETSLAFLVHPTIDSDQAGEMAGIVRAVMEEAQRK